MERRVVVCCSLAITILTKQCIAVTEHLTFTVGRESKTVLSVQLYFSNFKKIKIFSEVT
jgi:hypothetical protein